MKKYLIVLAVLVVSCADGIKPQNKFVGEWLIKEAYQTKQNTNYVLFGLEGKNLQIRKDKVVFLEEDSFEGKWDIDVYDNSIVTEDMVVSNITEYLNIKVYDHKKELVLSGTTSSFNTNKLKFTGKVNGLKTTYILTKK